MNEELNKAYSLSLEIEGLIQLAINRCEMTPAQVYSLLAGKCDELSAAIHSLTPVAADERPIEVVGPTVTDASETAEVRPVLEPDPEEMQVQSIEEEATEVALGSPVTEISSIPEIAGNESIATDSETAAGDTSADMRRRRMTEAMSLNDRYLFRRELFHNSADEMAEALDVISGMSCVEDADEYLTADLCLDPENKAVADFMAIVSSSFRS